MRVIKALVLALPAVGMTLGGVSSVIALNAAVVAPAYAADKVDKSKQVGVKVGKPLQEVLKLAQAKQFKEAMAKLKEVQAIPDQTPFEKFKVNEIVAYVAFNMGDTKTATKAYEEILDSGQLTPEDFKKRLDQLMKVEYSAHNYDKAITLGNRYLKEVGPSMDAAVIVAQSYYLKKDYLHAIPATQMLIQLAEKSGQPVQKAWLDLLRSSQQLAGKDDAAAQTLEVLLQKYPAPEYWRDMFIIEQNKGSNSDRKNLEVLRLKMLTGVLKPGDYMDMAQLALATGFPGDAKMILEKGFADKVLGSGKGADREKRLLAKAQADSAADEKQLPSYEKDAMKQSSGDDEIKLGEAYISYGDYEKGIAAINRGFKKGGKLKAADEGHLALGIAYYDVKQNAKAAAQFKAIAKDSKLASVAHLWLIFLSSQK